MSKKKDSDKRMKEDQEEIMEKDIKDTLDNNQEQDQENVEVDINEVDESTVDEISQLETELEESKDKFLRLFSEFENFRRRTAKEKVELIQSANADLIGSILPVLDDFTRALSSVNEDTDLNTVIEGVDLINQKLGKVLEQNGLMKMDTEVGTDFDPEIHEAITQIPAPEENLKGKIVDTIEPGYFLGEKVVRFAKVVIGN